MLTKKRIAAFVLIVLLITNVVILVVYARKGPLPHPFDKIVLSVIAPVHDGLSRAQEAIGGVWNHYLALSGVSRENEKLAKQVAAYRLALCRYNELVLENQRLAGALAYSRQQPFVLRGARVVAGGPVWNMRSLVIDRGSRSGAKAGMAVITPRGLVGRITQAAPYYSRVLLVTDPSSALDVRLGRSRARGIVCGDPSGLCRMKYVLKTEDVKPGDAVVTSGMDRLFAPGLDVGTVAAVSNNEQGMFSAITVIPRVNFAKIEEVLVIINQEGAPSTGGP